MNMGREEAELCCTTKEEETETRGNKYKVKNEGQSKRGKGLIQV